MIKDPSAPSCACLDIWIIQIFDAHMCTPRVVSRDYSCAASCARLDIWIIQMCDVHMCTHALFPATIPVPPAYLGIYVYFMYVIHMCHSYVTFICVIYMCHLNVSFMCHSYVTFICVI